MRRQAAIGAGMAEAARILAVVDPQLAAQIQLAIAQSGSQSLIAAFVAASNATQTASTVGVSTNFSASLNPSTGASGASRRRSHLAASRGFRVWVAPGPAAV